MAGNKDPKGYYALLGVPPTAGAGQIKQAYRSRAKALHPDGAGAEADTEAFQRLGEAYGCLGDPEARARYDAAALDAAAVGPSSPATSAPAGGGGAGRSSSGGGRGVTEPILCSRCGTVSAQPRYVIYWRVISLLVVSLRQPVQGVFCRACADRKALGASLVTWLLGWWGVPWGPVWTLRALAGNLAGGRKPGDANAILLRHQAVYFAATGKLALARIALYQALQMVEGADLRQQLLKLQSSVGVVDRQQFRDRWRPAATFAFWLHALPVVAVVVVGLGLALRFGLPAGMDLAAVTPSVPTVVSDTIGSLVAKLPFAQPWQNGSSPPPASVSASAPPVTQPAAPTLPLAADPPAPTPAPALPSATAGGRWKVSGNQLALRAGPAADRPALGRLVAEEVVDLLETTPDGWAKVRTAAGRTGYVARKFLVPAKAR